MNNHVTFHAFSRNMINFQVQDCNIFFLVVLRISQYVDTFCYTYNT